VEIICWEGQNVQRNEVVTPKEKEEGEEEEEEEKEEEEEEEEEEEWEGGEEVYVKQSTFV